MDYAGFDCKITVPLQSPIRHRDGELWATPCKRRRSLKRSLETAQSQERASGRSWQFQIISKNLDNNRNP